MSALNGFLDSVVAQIVNPVLLLLTAVAAAVFAWGVFKFVKGAADDTARAEGRKAILWGLVGFVIIFGAYGIIDLALRTFNVSVPTTSGGETNNIKGVLHP